MKKLTKKQMEIVKAEHPEWFNGIEVGKWYFKQYDRKSSIIFFCQGHRNGNAYGYGIDTSSNGKTEWLSDDEVVESNNDGFREATPEEVKQVLISEAKRRGFKEGVSCYWKKENITHIGLNGDFRYENHMSDNYLACGSKLIYHNGQWASVIPQEKTTLQYDIQALKDRWPDINFTIIAEGKK